MNTLKPNCGRIDRAIRGILSVALILYCIFFWASIGDILLQSFILLFALMNLVSTTIGWCPVYKLANINTCKTESK